MQTRERPQIPVGDDEARINEQIRSATVRLINEEAVQIGIVTRDRALAMAADVGMDLVEVAPDASPPVCKIMDYAKFKYQKTLRERQARKNQTKIDIKEIKFRPVTDDHDYGVKVRSIRKFLEDGDKVKCTLRFRGREMAHQELGLSILERVEQDLQDIGKVEQPPRLLGRQMVMVLASTAQPKVKKVAGSSRGEDDDGDDVGASASD